MIATKKASEIKPALWVITALLVLHYIFLALV
jgi:hypothetical protein